MSVHTVSHGSISSSTTISVVDSVAFTTGYEPCSRSLTSGDDNDTFSAFTSCRELAAALEKTPSHVRAVHPLALASWTPKTILSYEKGFIGGPCTAARCRTLGRGPGPVNSSNNSRTHDDYDSGLRVRAFTTLSLINTHTFAAIPGDAPMQPLYDFNFLQPSNNLRVTPDKHPHTPTISAHIATRFGRFLTPSVESYTVSISYSFSVSFLDISGAYRDPQLVPTFLSPICRNHALFPPPGRFESPLSFRPGPHFIPALTLSISCFGAQWPPDPAIVPPTPCLKTLNGSSSGVSPLNIRGPRSFPALALLFAFPHTSGLNSCDLLTMLSLLITAYSLDLHSDMALSLKKCGHASSSHWQPLPHSLVKRQAGPHCARILPHFPPCFCGTTCPRLTRTVIPDSLILVRVLHSTLITSLTM